MLKIVVGNKNYSSWSLRAWLMLKKTRQPFEEVVIGLDRHDTAENIRKYSPSGRVPVVLSGDLTVWDSLAIGEYLAETRNPVRYYVSPDAKAGVMRAYRAVMKSGDTFREFIDIRDLKELEG